MDSALEKALEFANYNQTFQLQRQILKEKFEAAVTFGYSGGIFKIDTHLLQHIQLLIQHGRSSMPVLDSNQNPIFVDNLQEFYELISNRYFCAINDYYSSFQSLKKKRSVSKLVDL